LSFRRPYRGPDGDDHVDVAREQFISERRETILASVGPPVDGEEILPLDVAELAEPIAKLAYARILCRV
jgi:hypothetical protein